MFIAVFLVGCGNAGENATAAPKAAAPKVTDDSTPSTPEPKDEGSGFAAGFKKGMGSALLHLAIVNGDLESTEAELKKGVDINWKSLLEGNTALHVAVSEKQNELLKFLLEKGADASLKNNEGKTPLDVAKETGNAEAEKLLTGK